MKRLLLLVALALPSLGLYSCYQRVKVPAPAVIISEAHEAFPTPPEPPVVLAPVPAEEFEQANPTPPAPAVKPVPLKKKRAQVKRKAVPLPRPRPAIEEKVEQPTLQCMPPFVLIQPCKPGGI